jgi:hypothetical protein
MAQTSIITGQYVCIRQSAATVVQRFFAWVIDATIITILTPILFGVMVAFGSAGLYSETVAIIMSVLFLYPLLAVLTFLVVAPVTGWWWQTLLWIALWIPIGRFSWWYYTVARQTRRELNRLIHPQVVKHAEQLREKIRNILYE